MSHRRRTMTEPLLSVTGLSVGLRNGERIVEDVSFALEPGEILGLVGESGSGKTTTALAILGFTKSGVRIARGSVRVDGRELVGVSESDLRPLRGKLISYVPQDPAASLNPSLRIGQHIRETVHTHLPDRDDAEEAARVLERVRLPSDSDFQKRFPHQLSGGQQQRVAIALALVCEPPVVVMDEPTTGLDVVTQARILDEIQRLRQESGLAIVYVSHNLAVVGHLADRIAVMYGGWIVEEGPVDAILRTPRHPYTHGLVASIPDHLVPRRLRGIPGVAVGVGEHPPGCPFAPRCPQKPDRADVEMPPIEGVAPGHVIRCFEWNSTPPLVLEPPMTFRRRVRELEPLLDIEALRAVYRTQRGSVVAVEEITFSISPGEAVALVGESGSGKTTVARCIAGLHRPTCGRIALDGNLLAPHAKGRSREARRRIQIIFQNPYDSLNPRHRIADAIAYPARLLRDVSRRQARREALELLGRVRLPVRLADRYPGELSGGERQRVAIARALSAGPDVVVCDEITSALDVSVQAAVLDLLEELRGELGLAILFISHDLGVVRSVADRALVLHQGVVREQGTVEALVSTPSDEYTQVLLDAAGRLVGLASAGPKCLSETR